MKSTCILRRVSGGYGGAEKVAKRFAELFAGSGKVHCLSAGDSFAGQRIHGKRGPNWWRAWRYTRSVDKVLESFGPDMVFSMERGPFCDIYRAGDGVHRRWVCLRYGNSLRWCFNPWHWLAPHLERRTVRSARVVVANSGLVKRDLEGEYPEYKDKIRVIYNGYDPDRFSPVEGTKAALRRSLGLPEQDTLFFFCGSGWERKGLAPAIRFTALASRLTENAAPCHLVVLGKGRPQAYAKLASQLGLQSQVHFRSPTHEVAPYYQAADLFLLPTLYDPFSNACLEALACGCTVLTTRHNGVAELIRQDLNGFVLDSTRPGELERAASWWRQAALPPVSEIARSVAGYTAEREYTQYLQLFKQLLAD